jgi:hypothetical protein
MPPLLLHRIIGSFSPNYPLNSQVIQTNHNRLTNHTTNTSISNLVTIRPRLRLLELDLRRPHS